MRKILHTAKRRYKQVGMLSFYKDLCRLVYDRVKSCIAHNIIRRVHSRLFMYYNDLKAYAGKENVWKIADETDKLSKRNIVKSRPLQDKDVVYNENPNYVPNDPMVAAIKNATILGTDAIAVSESGKVIAETVNSTDGSYNHRVGVAVSSALINSPCALGKNLISHPNDPSNTLQTASVLHSRWNNYYHWTLEHLLKLRGISLYEKKNNEEVVLIIPPDPPKFITETLQLLGYDDTDYTEWSNQPIHVKELVVPSYPELTPGAINWLRNSMLQNVEEIDVSTNWVFVSRQKQYKRRIDNFDEVKRLLKDHNVRIVSCEDITMQEEVQLFSSIDGLIGVHGAGLTAMVWGNDLDVVEIFGNVVKRPYYILANVMGHNYTGFSGTPIGDHYNPRDSSIVVDTNKLDKLLSELL